MKLGAKPLLGSHHNAAHVCRNLGEGGSGSPPKTSRTIEEGGILLKRQRRTFHEQRAKLRIIGGPWSQLSAKIHPQNLRHATVPRFRQIPEVGN